MLGLKVVGCVVFLCATSGCLAPTEGRPYNTAKGCFEDWENVDNSFYVGCGSATTYAKGDGRFWMFESDCTPEEFDDLEPDDFMLKELRVAPLCGSSW